MSMTLAQALMQVASELPLENVQFQRRFDKAEVEIIKGRGYEITHLGNGEYEIDKLSTAVMNEDSSQRYSVNVDTCTCPDFEKAQGNMCKHRIAIIVLERMRVGDKLVTDRMPYK